MQLSSLLALFLGVIGTVAAAPVVDARGQLHTDGRGDNARRAVEHTDGNGRGNLRSVFGARGQLHTDGGNGPGNLRRAVDVRSQQHVDGNGPGNL